MTPDFWPDLRAFGLFVTPALLVLAAVWAVSAWRERHPNHEEETD